MRFATGLIAAALLSLVLMAGAVFGLSQICVTQGGPPVQRTPLPVHYDSGAPALPALNVQDLLIKVQLAEPPKPAPSTPAPMTWRRNFL